ncbi:MAG: midcut-by-XrtH protein [Pseudomonadota bacterium]
MKIGPNRELWSGRSKRNWSEKSSRSTNDASGGISGQQECSCSASRWSIGAAVATLLVTGSEVMAQSGTLSYGPISEQVPIFSPVTLALLSVIVAGIGWAFSRSSHVGKGSDTLRSLFVVGTLMTVSTGSFIIFFVDTTEARVAISTTSLDQENGGSVSVPSGSAQFRNDTSIRQRILSLSSPCSDGRPNTAASNACQAGADLSPGGVCNTEFSCVVLD